ncbi:hypothetical protein [Azospirillum argentinense]
MGTCRGTGRYSPFGRQTYGLARIPQVTVDVTTFSEDVASTNVGLAAAYRRIRNEF